MTKAKLMVNQPSKQQLLDYANAVAIVNNYAYAITNQSLPVLQFPPANYASFAQQFVPAKQHVLDWTDNIFVSMLQLPVTIKEQAADLFNMEDTMINAYLQALIQDPNSTVAKTGLATALSVLQSNIQTQVNSVTNIENQLVIFSTNIYNDAQALTGIAQAALADAKGDQTQIANINKDIQSLKDQIANAQYILTLAEIGIGLSIFVGLIGLVCCFIPGAQGVGVGLIIVAVGGEAASIAFTVIETKRIQAMQSQIDSDQTQIQGLNQDIVLLNGISAQFNALYTANQQTQTALTAVKSMWTSLALAIEEVKTDLTNVSNDNTSEQYQQALTDFQDAETNWNEVVTFADALAGINYQWQDAQGNWHSYTDQPPTGGNAQVSQIHSNIGTVAA